MDPSPLRVAIYPFVSDLAGDKLKGLTDFIAKEFKEQYGIEIEITTKCDPYNLDKMESTYLDSGPDAYDVLEVDTIMLGELVNTGKLQPLDSIFAVNDDIYAPTAVESVYYKDTLYGVPTLQCTALLMEFADQQNGPQKPILRDWTLFKEMRTIMDPAHTSGIKMVGDFCDIFSWTLPTFYLDAYIDKHGPGKLYEGIDSNPADDQELIANMKHFTGYGARPDGSNPTTDGTYMYYIDSTKLINDITDSDHVFMYGYSENLGLVRKASALKNKCKNVLNVVSSPLDQANYLLTYTDAVVVNKSKYEVSPSRAKVIQDFVVFYTGLKLRTQYALGEDLPDVIEGLPNEDTRPRYVITARNDFYSQEVVTSDPTYMMFHRALQRSSPAPNHGLYHKRKKLEAELKKQFGMDK